MPLTTEAEQAGQPESVLSLPFMDDGLESRQMTLKLNHLHHDSSPRGV